MKKFRYHEMLPHEIMERRNRFPAAFIGLGGLEWHGEHLAAGNDALKAEKLCEVAAEQSGGFAFPTLWYGEPRTAKLLEAAHDSDGNVKSYMRFRRERFAEEYEGFGRTVEQQIEFYKDLIYHILVQMNTLEMRAVCLLCGHYPLHAWASESVRKFNAAFRDTQAFAGIEYHYPGKSDAVGGDHAAKWETSYLQYLRPDCVDMSVFLNREDDELIGVVGDDPRCGASAELGRKACELIVKGMVEKAAELIDTCENV